MSVDGARLVSGECHYLLTALRLSGRRWPSATPPPTSVPVAAACAQQQQQQQQQRSFDADDAMKKPQQQQPQQQHEEELMLPGSPPPVLAPTAASVSAQLQQMGAVPAVATSAGAAAGAAAGGDDECAAIEADLHDLLVRVAAPGGVAAVDPCALLRPFLAAVTSDQTNAAVTAVALTSILKFLTKLLPLAAQAASQHPASLSAAMAATARALARCRFAAGDLDTDQATLAKLLRVVLACVQLPALGPLLPDASVLELFEVCFRVAVPHRRQTREVTPLLRTVAENTLIELVQAVFSRFANGQMAPAARAQPAVDKASELSHEGPTTTAALLAILTEAVSLLDTSSPPPPAPPPPPAVTPPSSSSPSSSSSSTEVQSASAPTAESPSPAPLPPATPSVARSPAPPQSLGATLTPKRRVEAQYLALNLIAAIVEASCRALPTLPGSSSLLERRLPCGVMLLLHSPQPSVFSLAVRVLVNLFTAHPALYKLHFEAFLTTCFKLAVDAQGGHTKQTELVLHTVMELVQSIQFVVELYANYDCDVYCSNLLANLSEFLYKAAFPRDGRMMGVHLLGLEALLALVASLQRCIVASDSRQQQQQQQQTSESHRLRRVKQKKRVLSQAAEHFNKSAEEGIKFMQTHGMLQDPVDPKRLALFLSGTPGLNRSVVGDYLSARKEFNATVLAEYVRTLPLTELSFVGVLRRFMESFLVPGDANVIGRLLETFSQEYFSAQQQETVFKNVDACYIAAYSVVMLNVDLHNPVLKEHMTLEQYIHNSRGINAKENFPREMLTEIYEDVRAFPFKIPEDYPSGTITVRTFADTIARGERTARYIALSQLAAGAIDLYRDAFATIWNPLIATLSVSFESADDDATLGRVLAGFSLCGTVAARYKLCEVIDYLTIYLCKATFLPLPSSVDNPVFTFGINKKAHRAAVAAFSLAKDHTPFLRESWGNVFAVMAAFHTMDLLPDIPDMPDFPLPPAAATSEAQPPQSQQQYHRRQSSQQAQQQQPQRQGWLSALWWGSAEDQKSASRPAPEVIEAQERARRCADECRVFEMLDRCRDVDDASLPFALKALVRASTLDPTADEETNVFCLDLLSKLVFLNSHRLRIVWSPVFEQLSRVLSSSAAAIAQQHGGLHAERAAADILLLCINLCALPEVQRDFATALWTLAGLPQPVMTEIVDAVSLGLLELVRSQQAFSTATRCGALSPMFTLIRVVSVTRRGTSRGFEALTLAVQQSEGPALSSDEFALCIGAISHYARQSRNNLDDDGDDGGSISESLLGRRDPKRARERMRALDAVALRCIELLHTLFFRASTWELCSQPILVLSELSRDMSPEVRHAAMASLQRLLLAPILGEMPSPPTSGVGSAASASWAVASALRRVVFPLLADLLRPLAGGKDAANETRVRACSLLAKVVLQHLPQLSSHPEFAQLWSDMLGYLEQYTAFSRARQTASDILSEALPELIKNLLLVMAAAGIFDLKTEKGKELWATTNRSVEKMMPGITAEIGAKLAATALPPPQQSQPQPAAEALPPPPPPQPAAPPTNTMSP